MSGVLKDSICEETAVWVSSWVRHAAAPLSSFSRFVVVVFFFHTTTHVSIVHTHSRGTHHSHLATLAALTSASAQPVRSSAQSPPCTQTPSLGHTNATSCKACSTTSIAATCAGQ